MGENSERKFYAHSGKDGGPWQPLAEHLRETAARARIHAEAFQAGDWGWLAGLWHDAGKYSDEFQKLLTDASDDNIEHPQRVDHSTYGARRAKDKWPNGKGILLAYVIAGHHTGLINGRDPGDGCSSLAERLKRKLPYTFHVPENLFDADKPKMPFTPDTTRAGYEVSFFIRMLFSCLVDADFLDTERHMNPKRFSLRAPEYSLDSIQKKLDKYLEKLQKGAKPMSVNRVRAGVLDNCLRAANWAPGLFSLSVPTGGGKTLSSMAFALRHAVKHRKNRVIYAIPFTSIIEQNAGQFRYVFGDEAVLEHHSNYEPKEEDHRTKLASENWDTPIVVTTNVQFFESLFACRTSRCRKLHNIANSVIVLDEVQALPSELLLPCIETIRELALHYNCSIVLCSATQPAIDKRPDFNVGLEGVREIVENPVLIASSLKRVQTTDLGTLDDANLAERIKEHDRVLCVVNTRNRALKLYTQLSSEPGVYHLSAAQRPVDRSEIIQKVRDELEKESLCRVISTQLIEAGVDIDFPVVYREIAGIDSIAQAAGRCNREGNLKTGDVFVFRGEDSLPPGYFRHTAQAAESVMRRFSEDILSLDAIEEYFRDHYWSQGDRLDNKAILRSLQEGIRPLDFPFRRVAKEFQMIDGSYKPVIVPMEEEAQALVEQVRYSEFLRGYSRKFQKYTVQIPERGRDRLFESGCIEWVRDLFPVLTCLHLYDKKTGLTIDKLNEPDPSDLYT